MTLDSHTETISINAATSVVWDLIGDPEQLPRWAPGFARSVRREGELWMVSADEGERRVRIRVNRELGVVDYLAPAVEIGAFSRVVANGPGSEMLFTVFFGPDMSEADRNAQKAVIAAELETVRRLVEGID